YVTLSTSSGIMMAISTLVTFIPQVVISPFAGVWADRYSRKRLIIFADLLVALATLFLAISFFMGNRSILIVFIVSAVRSVGTGIQMPAVGALIPQLTPKEKLMRITGFNSTLQSMTMIVAPAASGALLSGISIEATFFIDVITAIIGITLLCTIKIPLHQKAMEAKNTSTLNDLKTGLVYALKHPFIKILLIFYAILMFLVTPTAFLTPLLIARTYGNEIWYLSANEIAYSVGATLGGLIVASWGGFKSRITTIMFFSTLCGLLSTILGFSPYFVLFIAAMFFVGITVPFITSPITVLLQEKVEESMLGRIFSLVQIVSATAFPVGMTLFGPLADIIDVRLIVLVTGFLTALTGFIVYYNKTLRNNEL
ncbi:MAG: MFS transporter, partial [Eubacterium sp.]